MDKTDGLILSPSTAVLFSYSTKHLSIHFIVPSDAKDAKDYSDENYFSIITGTPSGFVTHQCWRQTIGTSLELDTLSRCPPWRPSFWCSRAGTVTSTALWRRWSWQQPGGSEATAACLLWSGWGCNLDKYTMEHYSKRAVWLKETPAIYFTFTSVQMRSQQWSILLDPFNLWRTNTITLARWENKEDKRISGICVGPM